MRSKLIKFYTSKFKYIMIQFNKVVGATWLLALGGLGGCSSGL